MSVPNSNLPKVQMSASNSSLKIAAEGNGTVFVSQLEGGYYASGLASVPHNAKTDNLIWQVSMFSSSLDTGKNVPTPFESNDDAQLLHSYVSDVDLFVEVAMQSNTGGLTDFSVDFYYRVMIV